MTTAAPVARGKELEPPAYVRRIREYLKREEPEIWAWFASHRVREEQVEAVRFELLKSTYRLERERETGLYAAAEHAVRRLGLDVPVTLYQAQNPAGLNASLAYVPGEAHVVLHGPIAKRLSEEELRALLGHELSHLLLWQSWNGEYLIADQVLAAMTHDAAAEPAHFATYRLLRLYTEIFCDRGSLCVVEDPAVVVTKLVKMVTELDDVCAESYWRQADEIFSHGPSRCDELTHPDAFIRARAVRLWAEGDAEADAKIAEMIEGARTLEGLDLLGQQEVAALTRRLIDLMLAPAWIQSDAVLAHALGYFDDYAPPRGDHRDDALAADVHTDDQPLIDYYLFVLLDFVTADRDLEELPLAAGQTIAETLGWKDRFNELARRELRLRKKQIDKIDQQKEHLLEKELEKCLTAK